MAVRNSKYAQLCRHVTELEFLQLCCVQAYGREAAFAFGYELTKLIALCCMIYDYLYSS